MKKLLKFVAVLIILGTLAIIGLAVFVNTYFTDERLRTMLLPPMEQALGRSVEIGHIDVSLFTGINVYDVIVKEENGDDDFFSSSRFILSYDLVPLLNKQVVIHEIRLVTPLIKIHRDKKGKFNFESLALLQKQEKKPAPAPANSTPANLPFSITVDKMVMENGMVEITDATGVIPTTSATADISVSLGLQEGLQDITFQGDSSFTINTSYHGIKPVCTGKIDFSKSRLAYSIDLAINKDKLNFAGSMQDYLQGGIPPIVLNVSSQGLDLTRLLAVLDKIPAQEEKAPSPKAAPAAPNSGIEDITLEGQVDMALLNYDKIEVRDLKFAYTLKKGVLTCKDLIAATMDGEIRGELKAGLTQKQAYNGKVGLHTLQLNKLQQALSDNKNVGTVNGTLSSAFEFAGAGFGKERIQSNLTANGDLDMQQIKLHGSEMGRSLAAILNLPELNDLTLDSMAGQFTVRNGRLQLNTTLSGSQLSGRTSGSIGLDGSMAVPVTLTLSPEMSSRLGKRLDTAKYLEKRDGQTVVRLDVKGSISKPKMRLNTKYVKRQASKALLNKALDKTSAEDKATGQAVKGVLKSLFGK